jgi:hypothetical protein
VPSPCCPLSWSSTSSASLTLRTRPRPLLLTLATERSSILEASSNQSLALSWVVVAGRYAGPGA